MDDLIDRVQRGDRQALHDLFERHAEGLYRYAFHLTGEHSDAEDLVQETFLRAMAGLSGFRGDCAFEGWLFRVAMNLHLNALRRRPAEPLDRDPIAPVAESGPDEGALARLRAAIDELPARQQEVILLHTYRGMDSQEIARVLGCSYESVRMNLSHARRRLRERLADELENRL